MTYDFTSIIDRRGKDALAVDALWPGVGVGGSRGRTGPESCPPPAPLVLSGRPLPSPHPQT